MLGLRKGTVRIVPYSPDWPLSFQSERDALCAALGELALDVQHVGSTAAVGLDAKPIIDIAIAAQNLEDYRRCIEPLAKLGYAYLPERNPPQDRFFAKGEDSQATHHVHIVAVDSPQWRDYLCFRDYLRTNASARRRYLSLKRKLARRYADNRQAYTAGKGALIEQLLVEARQALERA